jgi:hypothetical protein
MIDMDYDDHLDGECWQCGGEGRVAGTCIDGCCAEQDDPYCEYCSRRCDVCHPPTPEQIKRGNELRQVLADALANSSGNRNAEKG